jgi:hypothetical protein
MDLHNLSYISTSNNEQYSLINEIKDYLNYLDKILISNYNYNNTIEKRNTIGPNKTTYDEFIYKYFTIETLTQDKKQWKNTLIFINNKFNCINLIKRIKEIRRRELQKQYNKELRDRKRNK